MGLDMYLDIKKSFYAPKWDKDENENVKMGKKIRSLFELPESNNLNYAELSFEIMYWRKANQIHKWFVDNIQEGKDDCGRYNLEWKDIEKLKSVVDATLNNKKLAEQNLPTSKGFFFGGTDYDECYWEDLENTSKKIEELLKLKDKFKDWSFEYHSSW